MSKSLKKIISIFIKRFLCFYKITESYYTYYQSYCYKISRKISATRYLRDFNQKIEVFFIANNTNKQIINFNN